MELFGFVVGIATGLFAAWAYIVVWKIRYSSSLRSDAVRRSQAVTAGKVHEQLVPYLPGFDYNPKDVRFLGSPTDLMVFDGLAEGRVRRIIFVEIKTGGATLTTRERWVREAVQNRRVEWVEFRVQRPETSGVA